MKGIYKFILKTLLYHCKDLERPILLLFGPTGILEVNIGKATIHSGLEIKPGTNLHSLNNKSDATSGNRLLENKFLITDELSTISSY